MNKKQITVFKELLADPNFKGKKSLEHLLWLNTTEPKYKEGDCFKVTDHGHTIDRAKIHSLVLHLKEQRK